MYRTLADLILVVHAGFVAFVLVGFLAALAGPALGWDWSCSLRFRATHLVAIALVTLQAWFGRLCPLTTWENQLRRAAGQTAYEQSFVQHWLQRLLYYDVEPWIFVVAYTVFAGLVLALWWRDRRRLH